VIRLALISDIHANLPALEAVAADVQARRPDAVYVLGDMVNGCPWPGEVLDLLDSLGWPVLMGNHDDAVLQLGTPRMETRYADRRRYAPLWWTRERLGESHLCWLAQAPLERCLAFTAAPAVRLLHGLPGNFFVGLRPDSAEDWAARRLAGVSERVVAGGHTHVAMVRMICADGGAGHATEDREPEARWLVVNTGSVGMPYDGDPRASYAWLEGGRDGWRVEIRRVLYDWASVEAEYRRSGLLQEGGPMGEMVLRSVLTGLPWVSDFAWWLREQPAEVTADVHRAQRLYDSVHGPGRWAFPYVA
jgi:predicted phosphodiesterase